jgi:hypothetical protein
LFRYICENVCEKQFSFNERAVNPKSPPPPWNPVCEGRRQDRHSWIGHPADAGMRIMAAQAE